MNTPLRQPEFAADFDDAADRTPASAAGAATERFLIVRIILVIGTMCLLAVLTSSL